jgi:hypothetical protein
LLLAVVVVALVSTAIGGAVAEAVGAGLDLEFIQVRKWEVVLPLLLVLEVLVEPAVRVAVLGGPVVLVVIRNLTPLERG